jgi:hypothetical protein
LGLKFWLGCCAAVIVLSGLALAASHSKDASKVLPVPAVASTTSTHDDGLAQDGMADAPVPQVFYRFAFNALLVPLLDDAIPPRWTYAVVDFSCLPGTSVMVNGKPMVQGEQMPSTAFTVSWNMDHCSPLGRESVELSGQVDLRVTRVRDILKATVIPTSLRVDSHMGRAWLHGPFTAKTMMVSSATEPCITDCTTGTISLHAAKKHERPSSLRHS